MKSHPILTSALAAAALCFAGQPHTASAQTTDAAVAIDAQLLAKCQGTLDRLRTELAAKLPKLDDTLGKWQDTEPVVLDLKQGKNVLKFCRRNAPQYGVALNSLILKPVN